MNLVGHTKTPYTAPAAIKIENVALSIPDGHALEKDKKTKSRTSLIFHFQDFSQGMAGAVKTATICSIIPSRVRSI